MLTLQNLVAGLAVDPGIPAFVDPDGTATSYPVLADRVRRLAVRLQQILGDAPGTVGILALNSRPYLEVMLATATAGRAAVPLNIRWAPRELASALLDADIRLLMVDDATLPLIDALRKAEVALPPLFFMGRRPGPADMQAYDRLLDASLTPSTRDPAPPPSPTGDTMAAIVYTGGTTGVSKGVIHTHGSLMASALNWICANDMPPRSRCLLALPLFHVGAIGIALAQLLRRGTLVMIPAFRPDLVHEMLLDRRADVLAAVPTMISMLFEHSDFAAGDYAGLRAIVYGASPMPTGLLRRIIERLPHVALTQAYGMTEVGLGVTLPDRLHHGADARLASAGQPGPLYDVRIVDPDGQEVPRGALGEVVFSGPGVMQGYLNQPQQTAEVLRNGCLRSGDIGMMDAEGVITLVDRKKDMIVSGGENVYSVEVESAVSSHPAVQQCAVIGVPDERLGERVHVVVMLHPDRTLSLEDLRQHCAPILAGYKHPRSLELRDTLPLSPMGKILKSELRASFWGGSQRHIN